MVIYTNRYKYSLAVILQPNIKKMPKSFTVLMLCNSGDEMEEDASFLVNTEQHKTIKPYMYLPMKELFLPDGVIKHAVIEVDGTFVRYICEDVLKVEANRIIEDYQKRQLHRFR